MFPVLVRLLFTRRYSAEESEPPTDHIPNDPDKEGHWMKTLGT